MSKNQIAELDELGLIGLKIDKMEGREIICQGKRLIDFATTNYLSFENEPSLHDLGVRYAKEWGATVGWSRLEADCHLYPKVEAQIAKQLGVEKVHLSQSVTNTGFSLFYPLVGKGVVFTDRDVHSVVFEAARLSRDHGAKLVSFRHQDMAHLEELLKEYAATEPKLICIDGVYSVSSEKAPVKEIQALAQKYGAWVYIDDAHGFGIYGRSPFGSNTFGVGGSGIVDYFGGDYSRTFYVGSFAKAYSTLGAFVVIPKEFGGNVPSFFLSNIYSAPVAPYTLGTIQAGLDLNAALGEARRATIRLRVAQLTKGIQTMGLAYSNEGGHPVVFLEVGEIQDLIRVATELKNAGVWAGLRPYPVVPKDRCGLRFAVSSLHSEGQINRTLEALDECRSWIKSKAA